MMSSSPITGKENSKIMRAIKAILLRNLTALAVIKCDSFSRSLCPDSSCSFFSFVMKAAATGIAAPMNYLISGIIIMTVFQSALNNSMNIIEDVCQRFYERNYGCAHCTMADLSGQIASATVISVLQGMLIVIIGLFL